MQVGFVSISIIRISSNTINLAQLFSVVELIVVLIFGPETSDFLFTDVSAFGKICHGSTELFPSSKGLHFSVFSEFRNSNVYPFFKVVIK